MIFIIHRVKILTNTYTNTNTRHTKNSQTFLKILTGLDELT